MKESKLFVYRIGLVGIINILIGLNSFILIPLLTKSLSVNDYGIWNEILVTIRLAQNFASLGLYFSIIRFLASLKDKEEIQEGFYSMFFLALFTTSIISVLIYIFSEPIASLLFNSNIIIVRITSFIVLIASLNYLIINYFRTFQEIKKYSFFLLIQTYLTTIIAVILVLLGYGIIGAGIGILISYLISFSTILLIIISRIGITIPKFTHAKKYILYSLPMALGGIGYWIVESSDRYIISMFLGTAFVGYYSPGYILGTIIVMLAAPFSTLLFPTLSKYHDEKNIKKVKGYFKYSIKYFLFISIPAVFGLSVLSKPLLIIITTQEIANNGYLVTPFIALGSLFYGLYTIISLVLLLEKKTKITGIMWAVASVLSISFNIILIPHFGILGAAVATLISYLSIFILGTFYSFKYITIKLDISFILKCIFASIMMSLFVTLIKPEGILNIVISVIGSILIYLLIMILLKGINKNEINFIKNFIK